MSEKRPLGVTVLAGAACLASAALLVYSAAVISQVFRARFAGISGNMILTVAAICLLSLAWISGVAALDLWKLRKRGRSLTITSMAFFCLLGGILAAGDSLRGIVFWSGCGLCAVTLWVIVYLRLPGIRLKFEAEAAQTDV